MNYLNLYKKLFLRITLGGTLILINLYACGRVPTNDHVVIRAGKSEITSEYLNQALEISKSAYPSIDRLSEKKIQELHEKVIAELIEEALITERAREMGISISELELNNAVNDIRKDYPEDTFETMLLEQSIPYDFWKKRLKKRLLIQKTISADLQKNMTISQADIADFHRRFPNNSVSPLESHPLKNENIQVPSNKQAIETFIKSEKTEDKYPDWIKGLKERYGLHLTFEEPAK